MPDDGDDDIDWSFGNSNHGVMHYQKRSPMGDELPGISQFELPRRAQKKAARTTKAADKKNMTKAHLEKKLEEEVEAHLLEHGWVQGSPKHYDRSVGLDTAELFAFIGATQAKSWDKLVGFHGGANAAQGKFAKRLASEITSRGTMDVLHNGVKDLGVQIQLAYFAPANEFTPDLQRLYKANRVAVTRQAPVSESHPKDTVDMLFTINGVPVATAELKTQTTGQDADDAIRQYRTDRIPSDLVFKSRVLVNFAVDQDNVYMTTQLAGNKTVFLPFNQGSNGPGEDGGKGNPLNPKGHRTAYLWEQVWQRDAWMNILASYVHIEHLRDERGKKTGKTRTLFPRYHQWDVVTKMIAAAREEGPGHNKLVQHSAGSGKSNSISWLAHQLSTLHTPADSKHLGELAREGGLGTNQAVFDKVIIVTDRVALDRQLQDTVASFDHTPGVVVTIGEKKTSADLREALESLTARIIVTTLQKFRVISQRATDLAGSRFAVVVDEAHSSQSGEDAKDMKSVLAGTSGDAALVVAEQEDAEAEAGKLDLVDLLAASVQARGRQANLTFFAFTATPKHKTLSLFGEKVKGEDGEDVFVPFHLYSMRQAIEEGFILDVLANYTTYKTYYRLTNSSSSNPDVKAGKGGAALARYASLHPTNVTQKVEIIVEHFRAHTQHKIGGTAKAMVVTRSRLHAVRYYEAIGKYIKDKGYDKGSNPMRALVAFSGTVFDPDKPNAEYEETMMNQLSRSLPEEFGGPDYQVLVVAEKYQTGFDQPLLHTMYVDKVLANVKAVQTLSRLNRTAPGKEDTFVLDFVNKAEDIQEAFRPFYQQTTASPTDPNLLYNLQTRIRATRVIDPSEMRAGVEAILKSGAKASARLNAEIDPAVDRWLDMEDDDAREDLRTALRDYTRAYAFLGQIVPFSDPELEELYYYSKYLLLRLPKLDDDGGDVDLSSAVQLSHLRIELQGEMENLSLDPGEAEPLEGAGEGKGKMFDEPIEPLLQLIEEMNERFGMDLTESDRIWFQQQETHLVIDDTVRVVALGNDFDQFRVFLQPLIEGKIVDRHEANDVLFQAYFDKPEFKELMVEYLTKSLYNRIRGEAAGA